MGTPLPEHDRTTRRDPNTANGSIARSRRPKARKRPRADFGAGVILPLADNESTEAFY